VVPAGHAGTAVVEERLCALEAKVNSLTRVIEFLRKDAKDGEVAGLERGLSMARIVSTSRGPSVGTSSENLDAGVGPSIHRGTLHRFRLGIPSQKRICAPQRMTVWTSARKSRIILVYYLVQSRRGAQTAAIIYNLAAIEPRCYAKHLRRREYQLEMITLP
jgi:hypothetical protein